ncbi:carboxypeptidase-like regulatory domain-containing protein [Reichenbachiella ulvae]|uniref:Carboxypeptidase-like regulatory domain-containing protein n=1 Tax=Reichenbachiella ulvae TaxID=2980104 RepID=A0ABT3CN86_9BACT|nr:carboxypeptidase-like regulatory domain-containing protein [Reichenbachiella ulvae]MCV9385131.1 carboxypeptidase-like regulatory domain-containing protein [Reichenbachiella ulvae]
MRLLFSFIPLLFTLHLQANSPISGVVKDAETKEALPFTNIIIEGRHRGSISNSEGVFVLDEQGITADDYVLFSYMGYKSQKIKVSELRSRHEIYLEPIAMNLKEVEVYSKSQSAEDIIKQVRKNLDDNYPEPAYKQKLFTHRYERVPFSEDNRITIKRSNFDGMDQDTFDEMYRVMPKEFTEYQDAVMGHYYYDDEHKLDPIEGVSLEEGAMKEIEKEIEDLLGDFMKDIESTKEDEDVYYKFRTGLLSFKADNEPSDMDSTWKENMNDSLNYIIPTHLVASGIKFLFNDYSRIDGKNWEFIEDPGKFDYEIENVIYYNEEVVYVISFQPKSRGLFQGKVYVSTSDYGILQADFEYAPGKDSENIDLLGVAHSMKHKKARVIFEKGDEGYLLKYLNVKQKEYASIDRKFSVMKKQKRFLIDKELKEIKMDAHLIFNINSQWEILVLDREKISEDRFEAFKQPKSMKFRKEYSYSPNIWNNRTVLVPTSELQKYTRTE